MTELSALNNLSMPGKATLSLLGMLIISQWLSTWWLASPSHTTFTLALISLLKTLPLAAFLPALCRQQALAGIWLGLVLMPYLCLAILGALQPGAAGLISIWHALLISACCTAAMLEAQQQARIAKTRGTQD